MTQSGAVPTEEKEQEAAGLARRVGPELTQRRKGAETQIYSSVYRVGSSKVGNKNRVLNSPQKLALARHASDLSADGIGNVSRTGHASLRKTVRRFSKATANE